MKFTNKAAAAAGSLAVLSMASQDAEATIVHVDGSPITMDFDAAVGSEVDWDVDGEFGRDFFFRRGTDVTSSLTSDFIYLNDAANGRGFVNGLTATTVEILNLPNGLLVGPSLAAGYFFGSVEPQYRSVLSNTTSNPIEIGAQAVGFNSGVPGFAGFAFDSNGTTLYGWASLTIDESLPGTVTINEWAYEDSGAVIAVGDTGTGAAAIPEPHSLAMIAMGAAGVAAWRRRRKNQPVVESEE